MLPGICKKCWGSQEITEPGKYIVLWGQSLGRLLRARDTWAEFWGGVLGRRTGKGNSSGVQNHRVLWKKGKCFESTALTGLGLASKSVTGVPSVWRKKEVKSLWKGSSLSGKHLGYLKAYMWYLLGQAPRKHSVMCKSQTVVSTKGALQLVLGIPYFPKPDSPQSSLG